MSTITVEQAITAWLLTLDNANTRAAYQHAASMFAEYGLLDPSWTLQALALVNAESLLDRIKQLMGYSEATLQARAAAFLVFFRFLHRRTNGLIKRAIPSRERTGKNFYRVRAKVATPAMIQAQWTKWLEHLSRISYREWLIARVALQGGKRISEVLSITTDQVNFENRIILFTQLKTKGTLEETAITYPSSVIEDLHTYLGGRSGRVFLTRTGAAVQRSYVYNRFVKAGEEAGIPFRITPHVLRASCITYLRLQGFPDSEIMGVTGHSSAEMIAAYDKRGSEANASKKVNLVI